MQNNRQQWSVLLLLLVGSWIAGCAGQPPVRKDIEGTWKMFYAENRTADTVTYKSLDSVSFIKIINEDHFAFFNQPLSGDGFYSGAGTYQLDGDQYTETLSYINSPDWRGHQFEFTVEVKNDTLIQKGEEHLPEAGIKRYIVEKFVRIQQ